MKIAVAVLVALALTVSLAEAQTSDLASPRPYDRIDLFDFDGPAVLPGLSGSALLGYSADPRSGAKEITIGGNLRYVIGQITQSISFKLDRAEEKATKGREQFAVYDLTFNVRRGFYGFVTGRIAKYGQADTAGEIAKDGFLGLGPGYRIIDTPKMAWRVQAGIGASYLRDGAGNTTVEPGVIVSSRLYHELGPAVFVSSETDILKTASSLRIGSDFGVSLKVSDSFAARISYLSEHNDKRTIRADSRLGVSLVMGF